MSVRQDKHISVPMAESAGQVLETAASENALAEGQAFAIASPDNPLERRIVVSIRSSLNELCLRECLLVAQFEKQLLSSPAPRSQRRRRARGRPRRRR